MIFKNFKQARSSKVMNFNKNDIMRLETNVGKTD